MLDELGSKIPFRDELTRMAVKLLEFSASGEIRENGSTIIGQLVGVFAEADKANLLEFVNHVLPPLVKAVKEETDIPVVGDHLTAIGKCIDAVPELIGQESITEISKVLKAAMGDSTKRRLDFAKKKAEAGDDEDELEELEAEDDNEEYLLMECSTCTQSLLRSAGTQFVPIFISEFMPMIQTLLQDNMDETDKKTALSLLCDFTEFGKASALTHMHSVCETFMFYSNNDNEELCQAALYGLGVAVELCFNSFQQPHPESVSLAQNVYDRVLSYLLSPLAKKEEFEDTTCNAVATAVKVAQCFGAAGVFDAHALMDLVVQYLPCSGDEIEAVVVHDRLLAMIETGNPLVANDIKRQAIIAKMKSAENKCVSKDAAAKLATL